jgi:hypothetical protein
VSAGKNTDSPYLTRNGHAAGDKSGGCAFGRVITHPRVPLDAMLTVWKICVLSSHARIADTTTDGVAIGENTRVPQRVGGVAAPRTALSIFFLFMLSSME